MPGNDFRCYITTLLLFCVFLCLLGLLLCPTSIILKTLLFSSTVFVTIWGFQQAVDTWVVFLKTEPLLLAHSMDIGRIQILKYACVALQIVLGGWWTVLIYMGNFTSIQETVVPLVNADLDFILFAGVGVFVNHQFRTYLQDSHKVLKLSVYIKSPFLLNGFHQY